MGRASRYAPEVRERAVRMVAEHQGEYTSQWAAMASIAAKIGCTPETLRSGSGKQSVIWANVGPDQGRETTAKGTGTGES